LQPLEFVGLILFELERPAAIEQEQRVEADDVGDLRKVVAPYATCPITVENVRDRVTLK
jgi:hypothetical protein